MAAHLVNDTVYELPLHRATIILDGASKQYRLGSEVG